VHESVVQSLPSLQFVWELPGWQFPEPSQVSPSVQAFPSSQRVPLVANWPPPWQLPRASQVSPVMQALLSPQEVPGRAS